MGYPFVMFINIHRCRTFKQEKMLHNSKACLFQQRVVNHCRIIKIHGGQFPWIPIVGFLLIRGDETSWMRRFSFLVRKPTLSKLIL